MKKYLYLDSSQYIQVGLISESFEWIHYEYTTNNKGSSIIHGLIKDVCEQAKLKLCELSGVIIANGPGSYTGIRLSEGIAQLLENEGLDVYSFYHFEVPFFCDISEYYFYANAFKNEVFLYEFSNGVGQKSLISCDKYMDISLSSNNHYTIFGELHERYLESTTDLIRKAPEMVFGQVLKRSEHLPPYYYRTLEKEFKPSFS